MVKSFSCFVIGIAKYSMIRLSPWLQEQIMWRQTKRYDAQHKQYILLTKLHTLPLAHIFPGKKKEKAKNIGKTDH